MGGVHALLRWVSEPLTLASRHLCSREKDGTVTLEEELANLLSLSALLGKGTVKLSRRKDLVWSHLLRACALGIYLVFPGLILTKLVA